MSSRLLTRIGASLDAELEEPARFAEVVRTFIEGLAASGAAEPGQRREM